MLGLGVSVICAAAVDTLHALLSAVKARATAYENESATAALVDELKSEGILDKATILLTPTATSNARVHSVKTKPSETLRDDFSTDTTGSYSIATDSGTPRATFTYQTTFARVTYSGTNGAALFRNSILTNGHSYRVTFRAKGTRATSFSSVGNNNDIGLAISNPTLTTDWQNYEFIIDATQAILRLYQSSGSATETLDIDDILVEDVSSDFDFDRASSATRINSSANVEDITSDLARINYDSNGNNGHILLEPTRTNDANYSQNASEWVWGKDSNANNTTRVDSQVDPYGGTSASQFTRDSGTSGWFANANNTTGSAVDFTHSIFVKQPASNASDTINMKNVSTSPQSQVTFTFSSESFTTESNATGSFEKLANGYYRLSMTFANGSASTAQVRHTLDDGEALIVFGIQHEEGSYPTSYIPNLTTGQTTRAAETLTGSGNSTLINSTEGVLYAEIAALSDDGTNRCIALSDGTVDNRVSMLFGTSSNKIRVLIKSGGSGSFDEEYQVTSTLDYHKVAMKYKANDFALWIDGVERFTDTSGSSPSGLDQLVFNVAHGTLPFYGRCKAVAVFNEALSDTELQNLTN